MAGPEKANVFRNLHREVKTCGGSEVNPAQNRRCFQYVFRANMGDSRKVSC